MVTLELIFIPFSSVAARLLCLSSVSEKLFLSPLLSALCSTVFHCVPLCSTVFHSVLLCSTVFFCVPLCSIVFHCVPLAIVLWSRWRDRHNCHAGEPVIKLRPERTRTPELTLLLTTQFLRCTCVTNVTAEMEDIGVC